MESKKEKKKYKTKKEIIKEKSVNEIEKERTGGQIALRGFDYQLIYSCYIALKFLDSHDKSIRLEGIEDIDLYKSTLSMENKIEHVQLKYSKVKENASFFDGILKNYLEIYLADNQNTNRNFKLVYDARIAVGNLSKLIKGNFDKESNIYWNNKIEKLKRQYQNWNWDNFDFDKFYKQLKFENLKKDFIINSIEKLIITRFEITNGNEDLFRNTLFYNMFHMAQEREKITYTMLLQMMQNTRDDITKGYQNPAYDWIDKIDFDKVNISNKSQYFEGKKATPADIVKGLPIRRKNLEAKIEQSVISNQITIIKSSSGQGKTTLAWQVAYNLRDEYSIYKINWCNDSKEINNIIKYFNSRLKLGEKLLIIIDNLDEDVKEWNKLAQVLAEKISINYSILITTREEDWYHLSGDQSNIGRLNIVDLFIDYEQAEQIYDNLKLRNKIHKNVSNWQSAWEKIKDRKVLIEYVYLLTHGEMIEDRISNQLKKINKDRDSKIKYEILRQISVADMIGIKIRTDKLIKELIKIYPLVDLNEIMISIENEYFVRLEKSKDYVEGLHPVRSKYISNILHKYYPIQESLIKILNIVDELYVAKVYCQIPLYVQFDKDEFYSNLARVDSNKSYKYIESAIKGVFSGSVFGYYKENKAIFDDADVHGGLALFLNEINPWNSEEFGAEVKALTAINKTHPQNENIKYLLNLSNKINKHKAKESSYYIYAYYLFRNMKQQDIKRSKSAFVSVANWLRRIDKKFDIVTNLDFDSIWSEREEWEFAELSQLVYIFYLLAREKYMNFIFKLKDEIFSYLRIKTDSLKIFDENNKIHIEYTLLPQNVKKANDESVKRITHVCRFLPIYDFYYTDSIKPNIEMLNYLKYPDDSHKEMPLRNVILSFNSDLNKLWSKSILSQYEFSSIYDWQYYWINIRNKIIEFMKLNVEILEKRLKQQNQNKNTFKMIDEIVYNISSSLIRENPFPHEERIFEEQAQMNEFTKGMKKGYFSSIQNYFKQFINIVLKNSENNLCNLAIINLKDCKYKLNDMQQYFNKVCSNTIKYFSNKDLEDEEKTWINRLILLNEYYLNNSPNKMFNRSNVYEWHKKKSCALMEIINNIVEDAMSNSEFKLIRPNKILDDNKLSIVPICVKKFDFRNENTSERLIQNLMAFGETNIDYIVIIIMESENYVLQNGISINTELFRELKRCIEKGKEFEPGILTTPLPCEVTSEHLECFNENLLIKTNEKVSELINVDIFLLLLWDYNKYKQCANEKLQDREKMYLLDRLKIKEEEIKNCLTYIIQVGKFQQVHILKMLLNSVIEENMCFEDKELNYWLNNFFMQ